jgi:uncharacterized protein
MLSVAGSQLLFFGLALALAGATAGLLAGLFGVGGGTVIVPVLYEVFGFLEMPEDLRMPICIGTSLAVIVPTSISSFHAHHRRGAADMSVLRSWAIPIMVGVAAGSFLAHFVPAATFKIVFVLIAAVMVMHLIWKERFPLLGSELPNGHRLAGYGLSIGASASLMGVGGGILSNLIMSLYGRPIHEAIATSSGVGVLVSVAGTIGYMAAGWDKVGLPPLSLGFVSLLGALLLIPTSLLTARFGAALAHQLSKSRLEFAFAIYLTVISVRFMFSLIPA